MVDSERIEELEKEKKSLEEEMKYLQEDLSAADEEVEMLEKQLHKCQNQKSVFITQIDVINEMKQIFQSSLHNVSICTPTIQDLDKLDLYSISSSVVIKASCNIDASKPEHQRLMDEFKSFDNISLRLYDGKDRWSILKDGEILFMAIVGEKPNELLSLKTSDRAQIQVFNPLIMESWLRGQKI